MWIFQPVTLCVPEHYYHTSSKDAAGEGSKVDLLRFETHSGELTVKQQADGSAGGLLCMDFPSVATTAELPAGMGNDSELVKVHRLCL